MLAENLENHILEGNDLRVDNLSGYSWIGHDAVHFSWKMNGPPGTMQVAYRIQAASSEALLETPDLWDSDWVKSHRSHSIAWGESSWAPGRGSAGVSPCRIRMAIFPHPLRWQHLKQPCSAMPTGRLAGSALKAAIPPVPPPVLISAGNL